MPRTAKTAQRLTVIDYLAMPDEVRCQLIDGGIVMEPAPSLYHQQILGNLHVLLKVHVDRNQLGHVLLAPFDVYFSVFDVMQPDLCFFSRERAGQLMRLGARGAPNLAVEIVSPSSEKVDRGRKRGIYAGERVMEYWLIDPKRHRIEIFDFPRDRRHPVRTVNEHEEFTTPLLPGLWILGEEVFRGEPEFPT